MDRRSLLGGLAAFVPALALLSPLRLFASPRERSDHGVPRRMDLRKELHPAMMDIELRLHGKPILDAVAYDLDSDTVVRLARGLDGRLLPETYMEYSHAGASVHWKRS